MGTRTFLVWVAGCNFVTVGAATYLTWDNGLAMHVIASIVALAAGLAAAFGIPASANWAVAPSAPDRSQTNPGQRERRPRLGADERQLTEQLALGDRLRTRLQDAGSATPNGIVQLIPEIDGWVATTHALLAERSPELARYFATDPHDLPEPNWPSKLEDAINLSQSGRLDRHLERLNELLSRR
jgi:hypothetical protein